MPRWTRIVIAIAAIVYGGFQLRSCAVAVHGVAGDPTIEAAAARAKTASDTFVTLAEKAKPAVPRQTDPAAKPLLDDAFDTTALSGDRSIPLSDLGPISDWGAAVNTVGILYLLAGTGVGDLGKAAGDPRANEQILRNVVTYAPEIGRYLDATFAVGGAISAIASSKEGRAADNPGAMAKIAGGLAGELQGGMQTVAIDGLDDDWRLKRLGAMTVFAAKAALLLQPPQCSALRDTATAVMPSLSNKDVRSALQGVSDALKC